MRFKKIISLIITSFSLLAISSCNNHESVKKEVSKEQFLMEYEKLTINRGGIENYGLVNMTIISNNKTEVNKQETALLPNLTEGVLKAILNGNKPYNVSYKDKISLNEEINNIVGTSKAKETYFITDETKYEINFDGTLYLFDTVYNGQFTYTFNNLGLLTSAYLKATSSNISYDINFLLSDYTKILSIDETTFSDIYSDYILNRSAHRFHEAFYSGAFEIGDEVSYYNNSYANIGLEQGYYFLQNESAPTLNTVAGFLTSDSLKHFIKMMNESPRYGMSENNLFAEFTSGSGEDKKTFAYVFNNFGLASQIISFGNVLTNVFAFCSYDIKNYNEATELTSRDAFCLAYKDLLNKRTNKTLPHRAYAFAFKGMNNGATLEREMEKGKYLLLDSKADRYYVPMLRNYIGDTPLFYNSIGVLKESLETYIATNFVGTINEKYYCSKNILVGELTGLDKSDTTKEKQAIIVFDEYGFAKNYTSFIFKKEDNSFVGSYDTFFKNYDNETPINKEEAKTIYENDIKNRTDKTPSQVRCSFYDSDIEENEEKLLNLINDENGSYITEIKDEIQIYQIYKNINNFATFIDGIESSDLVINKNDEGGLYIDYQFDINTRIYLYFNNLGYLKNLIILDDSETLYHTRNYNFSSYYVNNLK